MKFVVDETLFLRGKYLSLTTKKNGLREEPYKKDVKILCQTLLKTSWCLSHSKNFCKFFDLIIILECPSSIFRKLTK